MEHGRQGRAREGATARTQRDSEGGDRDLSGTKTVTVRASHRGQTGRGRGGGRAETEDPGPLSGAAAPRHPRLPPGIGIWGSSCRASGGPHADSRPTPSPDSRVAGRPLRPAPGDTPTPGFGALAGASPGLLPGPGRADPGTGHGVVASAARVGPDSQGSPAEPLPGAGTWGRHPPWVTYWVQG